MPLLSVVGAAIGLALFLLTPRQAQPQRTPGARQPLFDLTLLAGPVGLLALAGILRAMAFISFTNGMPLFLASVRGFAPDAQVIGLTLSLYSAAAAIGGVLAGLAATRLGSPSSLMAPRLAQAGPAVRSAAALTSRRGRRASWPR